MTNYCFSRKSTKVIKRKKRNHKKKKSNLERSCMISFLLQLFQIYLLLLLCLHFFTFHMLNVQPSGILSSQSLFTKVKPFYLFVLNQHLHLISTSQLSSTYFLFRGNQYKFIIQQLIINVMFYNCNLAFSQWQLDHQ